MDEEQNKDTIKDVLKQAELVSAVTNKAELPNGNKQQDNVNQVVGQNLRVNSAQFKGQDQGVTADKDRGHIQNNSDLSKDINLKKEAGFLEKQLNASEQLPLQNKKNAKQLINSSSTVFHSNKFQVTSQAKTFLAGGFTLFFAFLLIVGAIRPTISDIVRIKNQLRTYKRIAAQLDDKVDTIYQLRDTLNQKKSTLAYFDIYYPYNLDYSLFISNLEYMTRQEKAKLLSVNYSEHVGNDYIKRFKKKGIKEIAPVVFSITIQGDYNQLITFLKQIEDTPYLPQVITMGYRADQRDQTRSFSINVLLFRLKKPILKLKSNEDILQYVSSTQ